MRYAHLMFDEKFAKSVTEMYNTFFSDNHTVFFVSRKKRFLVNCKLQIQQHEVVFREKTRFSSYWAFAKILNNYDYVVLHSFGVPAALRIAFVMLKMSQKIIWISWGADLYEINSKGRHDQKKRIKQILQKMIVNRCAGIVNIFPPDIDETKKVFPKYKGPLFYAPYIGKKSDISNMEYEYAFSRLKKTLADKEPVYIMVGHQANPELNHCKVLDALHKFKKENIRVVLPLSYGDRDNAERVSQYAIHLFGDKAIILKEFLPKKEYYKVIERIDIAVFCVDRQIGLGNISYLLLKNTKIFMSKTSVMYDYYKPFCDNLVEFEKINQMNFQEFVKIIEPGANMKKLVNQITDYDHKIDMWKSIYNYYDNRIISR